jgi:hypothetical protein
VEVLGLDLDIHQLLKLVDHNQEHVSILNNFVSKVLDDISTLGTIQSSDNVIAPLNVVQS